LCNIAAHAQASEVDIILDDNDEALILTVRDNGIGLRAGHVQAGKHGLRTVRERVRYLGGALTLTDSQHGGATLTATLPKPAPT
jgi:signal transduction histidine kinase